jgi:hypothetical protein
MESVPEAFVRTLPSSIIRAPVSIKFAELIEIDVLMLIIIDR